MKLALVVGCAECLWTDVEQAKAQLSVCDLTFDAVCCVKLAGAHWKGHFDVWASLHPEFMLSYIMERRSRRLPEGYEVVCPPDKELGLAGRGAKGFEMTRHSWLFPGQQASGSSGLYGIKIMLDRGYKVVAAGIPMTTEKHFSRNSLWLNRDSFFGGWREAKPYIKDHVRSMSGWTKQLLGEPTVKWLTG